MLKKITGSSGLSALKALKIENGEVVEDSCRADEMVVDLSKSKKLKNELKTELCLIFIIFLDKFG